MKIKVKYTLLTMLILGVVFISSCSKKDMKEMQQQSSSENLKSSGITTTIPAYYDSVIFNIQFKQLSPQAAATQIAHNPGINFIYQSDPGLPGNLPFISVIDAVPGDGMNPIWREVQITFNQGFTPIQLYRDDQVLAAASGSNPMITLTYTDEVYSCPIMGKGK